MIKPCENKTYYAMALDPIHVGTGGYRLGRVDLSIVREPGTNLPKIPGTSLSGVARACMAMATGRYNWNKDGKKGSCAGQGQGGEGGEGHCGSPYCPVCVAFGFARGDSGGFQGLAQFADARILFFPVHSMIGPVWVTSQSVLREHGIEETVSPDKVRLASGLSAPDNRLNLGWLILETRGDSISLNGNLTDVPTEVKSHAVIVSDKLFSHIVNSNLEVRTSVSIDPATGAAEQGALFTYEAIPRGTVLWFPVTYSDPKFYRIYYNGGPVEPEPHEGAKKDNDTGKLSVRQAVEKGLALFKDLGIGGMNTRGMGRLKFLNLDPVTTVSEEAGGDT